MGVARIRTGMLREGFRWTLHAFIEDSLSRAEDVSASLDEIYMPAAQTLRLFGLSDASLRHLADSCRLRVAANELVADPGTVFTQEGLDSLVAAIPSAGAVQSGPVTVFVSSPSDLRHERRFVADVCRDLRNAGVEIEALMWEGGGRDNPEVAAFPSRVTGAGAQAVIDDHVWNALGGYDIYLGIVWLRAGTPTGAFRSGTEAEYRYALDRFRIDHRPSELLFYRKRPRAPKTADPEVDRLVADVRTRGLVHSFSTEKALRRQIFKDLADAARAARP
jgi:hypothetical protein